MPRRSIITTAVVLLVTLVVGVSGAQALVLTDNSSTKTAGQVNYGIAPTLGGVGAGGLLSGGLAGTNFVAPNPATPCPTPKGDPAFNIFTDLTFKSLPQHLCWHLGSTLHQNETFVLTWDPNALYWAGTRNFIEKFLSDVAAGSGTLTSPYSLTPQYTDSLGADPTRAGNKSLFGGGCVDAGATTGFNCTFGATTLNVYGGNDYYPPPPYPPPPYPSGDCSVGSSQNEWYPDPVSGPVSDGPNVVCLTDARIRTEINSMIQRTSLSGRVVQKPTPYKPLIIVLTPPGVVTCIDKEATLCSANGPSSAQFCAYHSEFTPQSDPTSVYDYVVLPWVASFDDPKTWASKAILGCGNPTRDKSWAITGGYPSIPNPYDTVAIAGQVGMRLVNALSQAHIAAITNPGLNGWFGANGEEINDNGCIPLGGLDDITVNGTSYRLQREYNNGGSIRSDPISIGCIGVTTLVPQFVAPGTVNAGDEVQLDSTSLTSMVIPDAGNSWNFGDGTTAPGQSVSHAYTKGGAYTITLTVTDRGGYTASLSQTITVNDSNGNPVVPPPLIGPGGGVLPPLPPFRASIRLIPESLRRMLSSGVMMALTSNRDANGFVTLSIPRASAKRAHISGSGSDVVVGRGTVILKSGSLTLHAHFRSAAITKKLKTLKRVKLTVRMVLIAKSGARLPMVVAGNY